MHDAATIKAAAVDLGYKMFDCASFYKNEEVVGEVFNEMFNVEKTARREDVFIISKAWWDEVEDVEAACRRSLAKLRVDYVDLYLVHWPVAVRPLPPEDKGGELKYQKIKLPMQKIW